jgi:hypothetical protein
MDPDDTNSSSSTSLSLSSSEINMIVYDTIADTTPTVVVPYVLTATTPHKEEATEVVANANGVAEAHKTDDGHDVVVIGTTPAAPTSTPFDTTTTATAKFASEFVTTF